MGKIKENLKTIKKKCRTCFNSAKGLQLLNQVAMEGQTIEDQKSYAQLLQDLTQINIAEDDKNLFPTHICSNCGRKLIAAYDFVKQVQDVNKKLWNTFNVNGDACLEEYQIEYPTLPSEALSSNIKTENNADLQLPMQINIEKLHDKDNVEEDDRLQLNDAEHLSIGVAIKEEEEHEQVNQLQTSSTHNEKHIPATEKDFSKIKETDTSILTTAFSADMDCYERDDDVYDIRLSDIESSSNNFSDPEEDKEKPIEAQNRQKKKFKKTKAKISSNCEEGNEQKYENIPVPCDVCSNIFQNSKELARHKRLSHIPLDRRFTCPICGNSFNRTSNMYSHMRKMHGEDSVKAVLNKKSDAEKKYQCDKCPKKYARKTRLKYHFESKHGNRETAHKEKKEKEPQRALCPYCGSSFSGNSQLIIHIRRHTGERPFQCDLCERAFSRVNDLTTHRRIHTGEKPFVCKQCGKAFRVSDKLKNHLRSHTDERPYKCTDCDRAFKYSKDLNIHYRIHTGERPYSCTVCGSTFTQSNSLKAHRTKLGHMGDAQKLNDNKSEAINLNTATVPSEPS